MTVLRIDFQHQAHAKPSMGSRDRVLDAAKCAVLGAEGSLNVDGCPAQGNKPFGRRSGPCFEP